MRSLVIIPCLLISFLVCQGQEKRRSAEELYELGETANNEGNYARAVDWLNACLTLKPGFTDAYFARAYAREQLKDVEGALTDYSIYLERTPNSPEALLSRGQIFYQLKKYDQAYDDFVRFLHAPPGATTTLYFNQSARVGGTTPVTTAQSGNKPLIYNYLGVIEQKRDNPQVAVAWLDSAITLNKGEADFYVNRALARQMLRDSVGAKADLEKALVLQPRHSGALHNLSVIKRAQGAKQEAQSSVDQAIDADSSMLAPYLERAYQRMEGGYLKGALEDYTQALDIERRDPEIWLSRGIVRDRLKDYTGAFADYTQAITLKENYVKAWINRANVLLKLERFKDAADDYTVALIYVPDSGAAYYNRAIARERLKQLSAACEDLRKAESLGMKVDAKLKKKLCVE
jgi:tetratricopeptide (TPR) repeat protein